ncbi:MAG: Heat shock protein 70 [Micavibrio sp.]|nr:Heat shock protein 70 [Micavibrio sp.]
MSAGGPGLATALVPLEGEHVTMPSAVFFNVEEGHTVFGRGGMQEYLTGYEGRLMRSLKSILGSQLIEESTQIGLKKINFRQIIGLFVEHIKTRAEEHLDFSLENVVMGRPVRFVDDDDGADQRAEDELRNIAMAQGFKNIVFEYEPLAAARDYESTITKEELVLVFDIGGGTSDFSVVRLSPEKRSGDDRRKDILANAGVHIGGTNFDQKLSLQTVMHDLGFESGLEGDLIMPNTPYINLSTWHLINTMYTQKSLSHIRSMLPHAQSPELLQRFLHVLETQRGHELVGEVEEAKIALSSSENVTRDLSHIEKSWVKKFTGADLQRAISNDIEKIVDTARQTVENGAGLKAENIDAIFMTGGSTGLPGFAHKIAAMFPQARIQYGDKFSSVAKGLGLAAEEYYG